MGGVIIGQIATIQDGFWTTKPDALDALITLGNFIIGYNSSVFCIILAAGLTLTLISIWSATSLRDWKKLFLLFAYIISPVIVFIISQITPIFIARQLLIFTPFFYIAISAGFFRIRYKPVLLVFFCVFIFLMQDSLAKYYSNYFFAPARFHLGVHPKREFKQIIALIKKVQDKDDIIIHSDMPTLNSFLYYYRDMPCKQVHLLIPEINNKFWVDSYFRKSSGKEDMQSKRVYYPYITKIITLANLSNGGLMRLPGMYKKRVWLVSSNWSKYSGLSFQSETIRSAMNKQFARLCYLYRDGIYAELFSIE
jgi:hypothetical protein